MRIRLAVVLQTQTEILCHCIAVDATHPRIRHVNTGRNAARRPDVTILYPACRGNPSYVRTGGSCPLPGTLVGRCFAAIEDAGTGEDCRAGADGYYVFQLLGVSITRSLVSSRLED